jgi:putative transposase
MERLNGEIRDREKTMRGIKKMDTPILTYGIPALSQLH